MSVYWHEVDVEFGKLTEEIKSLALSDGTTIAALDPASLQVQFYVKRRGSSLEKRMWAIFRFDTA